MNNLLLLYTAINFPNLHLKLRYIKFLEIAKRNSEIPPIAKSFNVD